jgi:hypothetical protein
MTVNITVVRNVTLYSLIYAYRRFGGKLSQYSTTKTKIARSSEITLHQTPNYTVLGPMSQYLLTYVRS